MEILYPFIGLMLAVAIVKWLVKETAGEHLDGTTWTGWIVFAVIISFLGLLCYG